MFPPQAPWTGIGSLQNEVSDIRRQVSGKADSWEIATINRRLDNLDREVREARSMVDELRYWRDQTEDRLRVLEEEEK